MTTKAGYVGRRINEVATMVRMHVETGRFYERQGITHQPANPSIGMRRYSPEIISGQRNLPGFPRGLAHMHAGSRIAQP